MPSTYHQCVKGRFNGKPIRIPASPTPFDLSEAHYFEATFYDELTSSGEDSTSKLVGIPLPSWQDIENNLEIDIRSFLDKRKKKRERGETSSSASQPRCVQVQLTDGRLGYRLWWYVGPSCLKQKGFGLNEASTTLTCCYTQETETPAIEKKYAQQSSRTV